MVRYWLGTDGEEEVDTGMYERRYSYLATIYHLIRQLLNCLLVELLRVLGILHLGMQLRVHEILGQELDVSFIRQADILIGAHRLAGIEVARRIHGHQFATIAASVQKILFLIEILALLVVRTEDVDDAEGVDVLEVLLNDDVPNPSAVLPDLLIRNPHKIVIYKSITRDCDFSTRLIYLLDALAKTIEMLQSEFLAEIRERAEGLVDTVRALEWEGGQDHVDGFRRLHVLLNCGEEFCFSGPGDAGGGAVVSIPLNDVEDLEGEFGGWAVEEIFTFSRCSRASGGCGLWGGGEAGGGGGALARNDINVAVYAEAII